MLLVLDTNQYLFAFGLLKKSSCESLIDILKDRNSGHIIRIPRLILNEVRSHLSPEAFREFIKFIYNLTTPDEDNLVPFEIGTKYEILGLKPADAFIAAYAEFTASDILVTENRHFLKKSFNLPFKVLTAEACLKILGK